MAADKLSAKEAALIAQARAGLAQQPAPAAAPASAAPAPQAPSAGMPASPGPAANAGPAERIAALMAAARAEHERERARLRKFYVWVPLTFASVLGLWTLAWLWSKI